MSVAGSSSTTMRSKPDVVIASIAAVTVWISLVCAVATSARAFLTSVPVTTLESVASAHWPFVVSVAGV